MNNYIDLHIHSIFSDDGEFTVPQIMEKCQQTGIKTMSITDHNSAKANIEAHRISKEYGIRYISGIEMDCNYEDTNLHLLGYGFDETSKDFILHEEKISAEEMKASTKRLELTRQLGFELSESDLNAVSSLNEGRPWIGETFAEVLLTKSEYHSHPMLLPYRKGGARFDNPFVNFYWDFYSQGKPCYVHIDFPTFEEATKLIHKNGGKTVLAHPGKSLHENLENSEHILRDMMSLGLDGVEVYCSYHNSDTAKFFHDIALKLGLMMTCGSDYHGKIKPSVALDGYDYALVAKYCELFGITE